MCGIAGVFSFTGKALSHKDHLEKSIETLSRRGPDYTGFYESPHCLLGHKRLSIIDTSSSSHQPMSDQQNRYTIVFNGEVYNYQELKEEHLQNYPFQSEGDTEVLLGMYAKYGPEMLDHLNGFFALAIFDLQENTLFIARDRMGIKPFYYAVEDETFIFGSELKALLPYPFKKVIDKSSFYNYLRLTYIPAPETILQSFKKLKPGHYMVISLDNKQAKPSCYYAPSDKKMENDSALPLDYETAQSKIRSLMEASVNKRLIADVPTGCFLSGGLDSSIVSAIAARQKENLNTFSVGYADHQFYDETEYAESVARKIGSDHHTLKLTNKDLLESMEQTLEYLDEPFADSSAIAVNILSRYTKKRVTVALSGDGADELFAGYQKHLAELKASETNWKYRLISAMGPIWRILPKSRSTKITDTFRKLEKFSRIQKLDPEERYLALASFTQPEIVNEIISTIPPHTGLEELIPYNKNWSSIENTLMNDLSLVLPNDMLTKVDRMSMANSLEVRTPFLDHQIVEFAISLPTEFKIKGNERKRILHDAFKEYLPQELYNRPKKGFEVPLLQWFRDDLNSFLFEELLTPENLQKHNLIRLEAIEKLKHKLNSSNPGDSAVIIWSLAVFQFWWNKYGADITTI